MNLSQRSILFILSIFLIFIHNSSDKPMFLMKSFLDYTQQNSVYTSTVFRLKKRVKDVIFSKDRVSTIMKKYHYYIMRRNTFNSTSTTTSTTNIKHEYKNKSKNKVSYKFSNNKISMQRDSLTTPEKLHESCINKVMRLIKGEPHPYHFDYCIIPNSLEFSSSENYIDTLVYILKQLHGYGSRPRRTTIHIYHSNSSKSQSVRSNICYKNNSINQVFRDKPTPPHDNKVKIYRGSLSSTINKCYIASVL